MSGESDQVPKTPPSNPNPRIDIARTERWKLNLGEDGKEFLTSMGPVSRDVWTRRIKKGRMTQEYVELFREMLDWWKKEKKKVSK